MSVKWTQLAVHEAPGLRSAWSQSPTIPVPSGFPPSSCNGAFTRKTNLEQLRCLCERIPQKSSLSTTLVHSIRPIACRGVHPVRQLFDASPGERASAACHCCLHREGLTKPCAPSVELRFSHHPLRMLCGFKNITTSMLVEHLPGEFYNQIKRG